MADRIEHITPGTANPKAQTGKVIPSKGRLLVTVFIVMLVMAYFILGISYLNQLGEHEALAFQIAEVKQTISEIPQPAEDLEQQLAEAQASQTAEQGSLFPREINTTRLVNTILEVASVCGVKATPMVTQPWTTEVVGEHGYPVLRLTVDVEGDFYKLVAFVDQLEEEGYTTLVMEELTASRGTEEDGTIPVIGSLKLAIYTRSLDSD